MEKDAAGCRAYHLNYIVGGIDMSYTAAVITVSDLGSRGLRQDTSGPAVRAMLEPMGFIGLQQVPKRKNRKPLLIRRSWKQ